MKTSDSHLQRPPQWKGLEPGPHATGFRVGFGLDYGRSNDLRGTEGEGSSDREPRPILMALWYPAQAGGGSAMPYGGYFAFPEAASLGLPAELATQPPLNAAAATDFAAFSRRLAQGSRATALEDAFGVPADAAETGDLTEAMQELLSWPTAAIRDAPVGVGCFPLVIYHPGLGGSFDESCILAEYLASHGYVVAASAFQSELSARPTVDRDRQRSFADLAWLTAALRRWPPVDPGRLAAMGHSYGAGAALLWRIQSEVVDAVVSLDSTLDYDQWLKPTMMAEFEAASPRVTAPLLVVAERRAEFSIARTLRYAERYLLTFADLAHDDFLSHAVIRSIRESQDPDSPRIIDSHAQQCRLVLAFLDRLLKGDQDRRMELEGFRGGRSSGAATWTLEHLAAEPCPPKLRDFQRALARDGASAAVEWLSGWATPKQPLLAFDELNGIVYRLRDQGRAHEAVAVARLMTRLYPASSLAFDALADACLAADDRDGVILALEAALRAVPDDPGLAEGEREADLEDYRARIDSLRTRIGSSPDSQP